MCHNVGDEEFRLRRTRAVIMMGLAREIAELNEALRGITEVEDDSRRFVSRMRWLWLWLWLRARRLKLRREILLGAAAVSFMWSAAGVCLFTIGWMEIGVGWLGLLVMPWIALGISGCAWTNPASL